jgi:hypothetical protein
VSAPGLGLAYRLSGLVVPLAAVAAGTGLMVPHVYRDTAAVVPAIRGQDLLTLIAVPVLALSLSAARRGSGRATAVWMGLIGYLLYTYAGAAFAYVLNELFLHYLALFSLCLFTLVVVLVGADQTIPGIELDATAPRRPVAAFLALTGIMVALPELAQLLEFFTSGTVPELVVRADTPTSFVYVLDLGLVLPLCLLSALWLWRGRPWGALLAGAMLVKAATMGLALLSMTWFSVVAGMPLEPGLTLVYGSIAAGSIGMCVWFLRHCHGKENAWERLSSLPSRSSS